jgi:hypothetical protein
MGLLNLFRRKKDDEAARIARLLAIGRIVDGRIVDVVDDADGNVIQVFFNYNVSGVDYESSQPLSPEQQSYKSRYIPGARVIVRYDPRQPPNSTVV